jgi:hypothetical protein
MSNCGLYEDYTTTEPTKLTEEPSNSLMGKIIEAAIDKEFKRVISISVCPVRSVVVQFFS